MRRISLSAPSRVPLLRSSLVAILFVLAGCASDDAPLPAGTADPGVGQGAEVYAESCAECHGADFRGTDKGPSFLSIVYEPGHHTDDGFRSAIANGAREHHWNFGDMDPVPGLAGDDVEAVIAFIRSEQERLGFE